MHCYCIRFCVVPECIFKFRCLHHSKMLRPDIGYQTYAKCCRRWAVLGTRLNSNCLLWHHTAAKLKRVIFSDIILCSCKYYQKDQLVFDYTQSAARRFPSLVSCISRRLGCNVLMLEKHRKLGQFVRFGLVDWRSAVLNQPGRQVISDSRYTLAHFKQILVIVCRIESLVE